MSASSNVEAIAHVFRCFICMEKLSDARMCPHCSKLCCYACIRRWLSNHHQQQQCPHCRALVHLTDFVICRWAEEVTEQLNTLKANELTKQKREQKDKCELHHETLTVYCSSCSKCICHQCALFNGLHNGHNFLPTDEVYRANMSIISERLKQLKHRHLELLCFIQDIEKNSENLQTARDEKFQEIRNFFNAIQNKVDEQFKTMFNTLNAQRVQLLCEAELIEQALHDIEHRISTNAKAEVIGKQQDILTSIETVIERSMTNYAPSPVAYDLPSEVTPQYSGSIFKMTNFSILQQNGDPVYSKPVHVNGLIWRLKVYPSGNGAVHGIYLSVFLELTHGFNTPLKYEYRIEMIHQLSNDSTKNFLREFTSDFDNGECWGYNKYFLLDDLATDGFLDIDNNTLAIQFAVRPLTYQQQSHDRQLYIKFLENDNQQLNDEVKVLREKVQSFSPHTNNQITEISPLTANIENYQAECLADTAIDITEFNDGDEDEDDDNQYTSIASYQLTSDEDTISLTEYAAQKVPKVAVNHFPKTREIPTVKSPISANGKSNAITPVPFRANPFLNEIQNELQSCFNAVITELVTPNVPNTSVTDLSQSTADDQQHTALYSNELQSHPEFRFQTTIPHDNAGAAPIPKEPFPHHNSELNSVQTSTQSSQIRPASSYQSKK